MYWPSFEGLFSRINILPKDVDIESRPLSYRCANVSPRTWLKGPSLVNAVPPRVKLVDKPLESVYWADVGCEPNARCPPLGFETSSFAYTLGD